MRDVDRPAEESKIALVTTTVHVPRCLEAYLQNAERHDRLEQLDVVVVGDRKTPGKTRSFLADLGRRFAPAVTYLDVESQQQLLRRWPMLDHLLRYDSRQRRNIGYLKAALDGADVIISVDDDNFVTEDDYFGAHLTVGRRVELPLVSHPSGWWNICERLVTDPPRRFYCRGYPHSRRDWTTGGCQIRRASVRAAVNVGLWLNHPNVDATTNLEEPISVVSMQPIGHHDSCALAPGVWCPFGTENTAFDIATLPAMYLPVMHDRVAGWPVGRLDDVWMSYFLRAIADQLGDAVLFGAPLAVRYRNSHDSLDDLKQEVAGYPITERLIEHLRGFETSNTSYLPAYGELVDHLRASAEADPALDPELREYVRLLTVGMAAWHAAVGDVFDARPVLSMADRWTAVTPTGLPC